MRFRPAVRFLLHTQYAHGFITLKLQIVQELKPNDSVLRLQFCENLLAKINCEMDST
jgi:hypothetical protein